MQLRPYQHEALVKTIEHIKAQKTNKFVWVMATGTGKTVCFSELARLFVKKYPDKKVLILAHREELLEQARNKILQVNPELRVGIEQAGRFADHQNDDIIIASVPTIGRENSTRILNFDPKMFSLAVVDEAHHASATSYKNVFKHFGVLKIQKTKDGEENQMSLEEGDTDWNKDCILLGVTATPSRSDNKGINEIFDKVVFEYNIIKAIKEGFLTAVHAVRVKTNTDISNVGKTAGDFNVGELDDAVNTEERNNLVVKTYKELLNGKQALVFAVKVDHAKALAETFIANGVSATYIFGSTEKEWRDKRLAAFANKEINVMVNVSVFSEGVDIPSIDAVLMARPTSSGIFFNQAVGRGTRLYPGKEFLTIVDFVDITQKQRLMTSASLLGKSSAIDFKGRDILSVQSELDELQALAPMLDLETIDMDHIQELIEKARYDIETVDILSAVRKALPLEQYSTLEWHDYEEDSYSLSLGQDKDTQTKTTFYIYNSLVDQCTVKRKEYNPILKNTIEDEVGIFDDIQEAVEKADEFIRNNYGKQVIIADSSAGWKKQKHVSESQAEWLLRYQQSLAVVMQMTKGDGSRALSSFFGNRDKKPLPKGAIKKELDRFKELTAPKV